MPDLTRPWLGPTNAPGIGMVHRSPRQRWCKYGKHYFDTCSRSARCCDAKKCLEIRKEAQRESNRRSRSKRIARGAKN